MAPVRHIKTDTGVQVSDGDVGASALANRRAGLGSVVVVVIRARVSGHPALLAIGRPAHPPQ